MSVLTRKEILAAMVADKPDDRLVVSPILDPKQVGNASIDVRLGKEFLLLRRTDFPFLDLAKWSERDHQIGRSLDRVFVEYRRPLVLHPHQLVLAGTLEYVRLPTDIGCDVVGRSSLGRLGLVIATAVNVAPGFRGCITLELVNLGEVPVQLFPGLRIAQLILHRLTDHEQYDGKYLCATGPESSRIYEDHELQFLAPRPPS